jgi:DUF971 family protein
MSAYDHAGRPKPTEIRYAKESRELTVHFDDGQSFTFSAELLRVESPSAEVKGHGPGQEVTVAGRHFVAISAIEQIGNYAIRITFDDGHSTGIYSWDYLYGMGLNQPAIWAAYLARLTDQGLSRDIG